MEGSEKWMKRLFRGLSYVIVAVIASVVTMVCFSDRGKLDELQLLLQTRFVGEADPVAMEEAASAAMVAALGDQWSYYIPASAYESYVETKTNSYVGIGITVVLREDGTGFDITRVEPGSGASEAGIVPGDVLVEADGHSLVGVDINMPGQYIKGEENTSVAITVLRDGKNHSFTVMRKKIESRVATGQMLDGNTGYVKISNFNDRCADETIAVIDDLVEQGAAALIFDVRDNPGGYRTELVKLLDYLLPKGILFHSEDSNGTQATDKSDEKCLRLPMAVLVNGESYSAAEFFAAALREYDWATVVGMPTCGKGYYQQTFRLSDGSAVGLSTGAYYTPKGVNLAQAGGLIPDMEVAVDEELAANIYAGLVDPMEDPQILAALEIFS